MKKNCPLCEKKRAKRKCPLHGEICPTCCARIRAPGTCPSNCSFLHQQTIFEMKKEIERKSHRQIVKLSWYEKNREKFANISQILESALAKAIKGDSYYEDAIIREGIINSQKYFNKNEIPDDDEFLLNRVGTIERTVVDVFQSQVKKIVYLSKIDIDAILEREIDVVEMMISEGGIDAYCKKLNALFNKSEDDDKQRNDNQLII